MLIKKINPQLLLSATLIYLRFDEAGEFHSLLHDSHKPQIPWTASMPNKKCFATENKNFF